MITILKIYFFAIAIPFLNMAFLQPETLINKEGKIWHYDVECLGVGSQGTKLIKIFSYSKKPNIVIEEAKKNAIHAMIFQGFNRNSLSGCPAQKPLVDNPALEQERVDYFDAFFADGGKYLKFVFVSGDGSIAPEDRSKAGKEYKIGIVVSVMYDDLRKDLEAAGIVKKLSSGF